ncbi:MAG: GH1 family beta-glucosidase [Actinomycetales bacterium]|nr:GH1 family beta-glucosidase [Actinomycetales bacterium]
MTTTPWVPGGPGTLSDGRDRSAFPSDFLWGTATASYQVEGSPTTDGKGPSIWDTFTHEPGRVAGGENGDVACDHYVRMPEDVALMAGLGVNAYRFSVSWPRVRPIGSGAVEPRGLDFYDRLVDQLLAAGIAPTLTLYHWDLPQALEDAGGWLNRDTAYRFGEYAGIVAERLGDRVHTWITVNEAVVVSTFGYALGTHAPGRMLLFDSFPATHHVLLGHGLAAAAVRAAVPGARVAITHNLSPVHAVSDSDADRRAAAAMDAIQNGLYMDPVLLGRYPDPEVVGAPMDRSCVLDGDLDVIRAPLDALGINYYNPTLVKAPGEGNPFPFEITAMEGYETTDMGWPVVPDGLRELLVGVRARYGDALPPVMVTENGAAFPDVLIEAPEGDVAHVDDPRRVEYLRSHIAAVAAARDAGVDVTGYFVWSLLDNFEWAEGYAKRFGLIYVDYPTQRRIPKLSYSWYRAFLGGPA